MNSLAQECPRCAEKTAAQALYCSSCGWKLAKPYQAVKVNRRTVLGLILFSALIALAVYGVRKLSPIGERPQADPQQFMAAQAGERQVAPDAELDPLRQAVKEHQGDVEKLELLAQALMRRFQGSEKPDVALAFEAIDALRELIRLDPKNIFAMLSMAEVAYGLGVFDKAHIYYARYLELKPEDALARTRYATCKIFLGQEAKAEQELKLVLVKIPKDFEANAGLAIVYLRLKKQAEAEAQIAQTLNLAPSPKAKEDFRLFIEDLKSKSGEAPASPKP
jgi:predicted Zn-dependent protease